MDIRLVGMDAVAVTRLIKKLWFKVSVLVMTMYVSYQVLALFISAYASPGGVRNPAQDG